LSEEKSTLSLTFFDKLGEEIIKNDAVLARIWVCTFYNVFDSVLARVWYAVFCGLVSKAARLLDVL
jgi:hypothetical protein